MPCQSNARTVRSLVTIAAAAVALVATVSRADTAPQPITAVDVDGSGDSAFVRVRGWKDPAFTAFRLDQPDRVIVDLRNGDVSALAAKGAIIGKGPVLTVTPRHIADEKATVARIVIAVKPNVKYDVRNDGTDLVIELRTATASPVVAQASPAPIAPALVAAPAPVQPVKAVQTAAVATIQAAPMPRPQPAASDVPGQDPKIVRVEVDRLPGGATSGTRVMEAKLTESEGRAILELKANGPVTNYQLIELKEPGRIALDLEGFEHGTRPKVTSAGPLTDLRFGRHDGNVRVVLQARGDHFPPFTITRTKNGMRVTVESDHPVAVARALPESLKPRPAPATPVAPAVTPTPVKTAVATVAAPVIAPVTASVTPAGPPAPAATPAPTKVAAATAPAPVTASVASSKSNRPVQIASIDVSGQGRMSRVVVALDEEPTYEEQPQAEGTRMLVIKNAHLPKDLERRLDASALEGPVFSLASYPQADGTVRLLAALRASEVEAVSEVSIIKLQKSYGLEWKFTGVAPRRLLASNSLGPQASRLNGPGGFMGEAASYAQSAGPRAAPGDGSNALRGEPVQRFKDYEGKRVDFTAKDLDITQFLQAIAEIGHVNIVQSDDVQGKVTIRLRNVPWEEALDIVLKTKGFGKEQISKNILRVAPIKVLQDERSALLAQQQTNIELEPMRVRLIPVNFAPAEEISKQVADLLTPKRGSLTVDARTNVLIVRDVQKALERAELLVRQLDTQTPQVLIEARIVEASTSFSHSAGIQWGGNVQAAPGTGNPTGLVFPNIISVAGAADDGSAPTAGNPSTPNYAVNMPTTVGVGTGGGLGFIFGSAGGAANLNLRLTAAEQTGTIKTVSAPKAVTLDHGSATISQGVSIPFSQVSAAGASTQFIEARLALTVTPHVTADGSVLLKLSVTNNQPNASLTGSNGQPSISRKEATTTVLVKDGDTTVIGGIYTRQTSISTTKVPWLAEIPIIGAIFKQNSELDDRTEMLIFVSPRIINRQQSAAQSGDLLTP